MVVVVLEVVLVVASPGTVVVVAVGSRGALLTTDGAVPRNKVASAAQTTRIRRIDYTLLST